MADTNSTPHDYSRFQLSKMRWRETQTPNDQAFRLLDRAYETLSAISGITRVLIEDGLNKDADLPNLSANGVGQLLGAIEQLSTHLGDDLCNYADVIDAQANKANARGAA